MKILLFIIIIILLLIIYFLKSKVNQMYEPFGNLLDTANTKYSQTMGNVTTNKIQINPSIPLNITTDLTGNMISSQDVLATNIILDRLNINPNVVHSKFIVNNPIISNIKSEEIQNFLTFNIKTNYMYDPKTIIIYEDIIRYTNLSDASGVYGTDLTGTTIIPFRQITRTWAQMAPSSNPWNGFNIYNIGIPGNGIEFAIPAGCNVLWLLCLSDRVISFKICDLTGTIYGIYAGGRNYSNHINPGGTVSTLLSNNNMSWIQIPLYWLNNNIAQTQRKVRLHSYLSTSVNTDAFWVSKIAFTSNQWNHVIITPQMIYYDTNSITYIPVNSRLGIYPTTVNNRAAEISDYALNWFFSDKIKIKENINFRLRIPIIKSGKNKILYFISINRSLTFDILQVSLVDPDTSSILIKLDNLKSTYLNPFATHYNSKLLNSYRATIIPDSFIRPDSFGRTFITINLFLPTGSDFYIRELGTHDEN